MVAAKRTAKTATKAKAKRPKRKAAEKTAEPAVAEEKAASPSPSSLLDQILDYTGRITGSLVDVVKSGSAVPLMYSDSWLKEIYFKSIDPERMRAMAEAGALLKDAREVAGLSISELAAALDLKDTELLKEVEGGRATLPFDIILRIAALIARHDPIPFIINFLRTYNPNLEKRLNDWGLSVLPKHFERERRLTNIYRQHDILRRLSDPAFDRLVDYQEKALEYAIELMHAESKHKKS